jgi:hypothetical protein
MRRQRPPVLGVLLVVVVVLRSSDQRADHDQHEEARARASD